jgi:uncharacterized protein
MSVDQSDALVLSKYHVVSPQFVDEDDRRAKHVVFATRTAQVIVMDAIAWQLIESGAYDHLPSQLLSELREVELLIPSDEDELAAILNRSDIATRENDVLPVVIQPTAFCQLGCHYCGQRHSAMWLGSEQQEKFTELIRDKLASHKFRRLEVCWFGAEPLSGINVIRSLTPRLKELTATFRCEYNSTIVTNGLALTDNVAAELVNQHHVRSITVSLDGTEEYHDARRHKKNGQATFSTIFQNVVSLARRDDLDVELIIRTNVDRNNCDGVLPLLRMLADAGVQKKIHYYVAPIHSWGNDAHLRSLTPQEFAAREVEWLCEMMQLGFSLEVIPDLQPVVCLAVNPYGTLIDATGALYSCTEVSYVPTYGNPNKYAIGDVTRGEDTRKRAVFANFNDRVRRREIPCSTCRMLPVCGGACPKAWLEGLEPCPSTKLNIEQRLLLSLAYTRISGKSSSSQMMKSIAQ